MLCLSKSCQDSRARYKARIFHYVQSKGSKSLTDRWPLEGDIDFLSAF
jgi:hypothetical protein